MTAMERRFNVQDEILAPSDGCLQMDNRGGRRHKSHQEPLLGPNLGSRYRERNPSLKAGDTDTAVAENSSGTPKVKISKATYNVANGENVILQCDVEAEVVNIQWRIKKEVDETFTDIKIDNKKYIGGSADSPSLVIQQATEQDAGIYICHATNDFGEDKSNEIHVSVTALVQENVSVVPAAFNEMVNIAQRSDTKLNFTYYNNVRDSIIGKDGTIAHQAANDSDSKKLLAGIAERTREAQSVAERYVEAFGQLTEFVIRAQPDVREVTVKFIVDEKVEPSPDLPKILQEQIRSALQVDERIINVVLIRQCIIVSFDITGASFPLEISALALAERFRAGLKNGSICLCDESGNPLSTRPDSTNIKIKASYDSEDTTASDKPVVSTDHAGYIATTGEITVLSCKVLSSPAVSSVTWFRINEEKTEHVLKIDNKKYYGGSPESPSLVINNTVHDDSGLYICRVENSRGKGESFPAFLLVHNKDDKILPKANRDIKSDTGPNVKEDDSFQTSPWMFSKIDALLFPDDDTETSSASSADIDPEISLAPSVDFAPEQSLVSSADLDPGKFEGRVSFWPLSQYGIGRLERRVPSPQPLEFEPGQLERREQSLVSSADLDPGKFEGREQFLVSSADLDPGKFEGRVSFWPLSQYGIGRWERRVPSPQSLEFEPGQLERRVPSPQSLEFEPGQLERRVPSPQPLEFEPGQLERREQSLVSSADLDPGKFEGREQSLVSSADLDPGKFEGRVSFWPLSQYGIGRWERRVPSPQPLEFEPGQLERRVPSPQPLEFEPGQLERRVPSPQPLEFEPGQLERRVPSPQPLEFEPGQLERREKSLASSPDIDPGQLKRRVTSLPPAEFKHFILNLGADTMKASDDSELYTPSIRSKGIKSKVTPYVDTDASVVKAIPGKHDSTKSVADKDSISGE